jgi:hypothetical protein
MSGRTKRRIVALNLDGVRYPLDEQGRHVTQLLAVRKGRKKTPEMQIGVAPDFQIDWSPLEFTKPQMEQGQIPFPTLAWEPDHATERLAFARDMWPSFPPSGCPEVSFNFAW